MRRMKKLVSILAILAMTLVMCLNASAEGTEGSITIKSSSTVSVAGKTFNAYKILDASVQGTGSAQTIVYTVPSGMKSFYTNRYNLTGNEGDFDAQVVTKIAEEEDLFAFASGAIQAAKTAGISAKSATGSQGADSVTISDLPLGYYVVEDTGANTPVSALVLDTTTPSVSVTIKADKPEIDKKIDGNSDTDDTTTGNVSNNNAAIGDKVPYVVTSKVPDMTGYKKYYFVVDDTLSKGLTFNNDTVIKVGTKTLVKDTDYSLATASNADGTTSVKIVFKNFIQYAGNTGAEIKITYSATLNKDAVIGTAGNDNRVKLTYSNNPNVDESGTPGDEPDENSPVGETPESITRTYVTGLELIKVDSSGKRLTGAEFKLEGEKTNIVLVTKEIFTASADGAYWKLKDGTYTTDEPDSPNMDQDLYESTTVKYTKSVTTEQKNTKENVSASGTVGGDGVLRFEGLAAGTYTITELKAPDGYNLLKDPLTVTISFAAPQASGTECTWTYTRTDVVNGTATNHITIENKGGSELPSTGGIGTTIFYAAGLILMLGAAAVLIMKKRMNANK